MQAGEKAILKVPAELAYGKEGVTGVHEAILDEQNDFIRKEWKRFLLYDVPAMTLKIKNILILDKYNN